MPNVLILHGNGGSRTRFVPLLKRLIVQYPEIQAVIPALSGFDGRPISKQASHWDLFVSEIREAIGEQIDKPWVLYGHGIGGSILMELAARDFRFADGTQLQVSQTILHAPIGATLQYRRFPKLMRPPLMRRLGKWLLTRKSLQKPWEKRLFQDAETIPPYLRDQFFRDYTQCAAFGIFFDLITPPWYEAVREKIRQLPFLFLWGEDERVIKVAHLQHWRADFPRATFEIVPGWDHFPMLEQPEAFTEKFVSLVLRFSQMQADTP